jgi:hypothetical protein
MRKSLNILLIFLFFLHFLNAQKSKKQLKEIFVDAQFYIDAENYYKAFELCKEELFLDPKHQLAGVDAAYCIAKLNYPIDSAFFLESNLMQTKNIDAKYYLAKIKHKYKKFDEAIDLLEEYKKTDRKHHLQSDNEIDYLIDVCNNGKTFVKNAHLAVIKNLGPNINSEFDDYVPIITPDESNLYFTSKRAGGLSNAKNGDNNYYEDIYVSQKKDGIWQKAENVGFPLNTENNDACVAINHEGNKMIVYRSTPDGSAGHLYLSEFGVHKHWQALTKLSAEVNSKYIETSACFSDDSLCIFFSSNRPGGYGGKDLYMIKKLPNGNWGKAFNLGPVINTKYDEDSPFLHPDGQTFYFSSKGHNTMGEYDIFKSDYDLYKQAFQNPENLGYPINDVGNDIFFVLSGNSKTGYFSSNKPFNFGGEDIYYVDMRYDEKNLMIKEGYVLLNSLPGKAKITLRNSLSNELVGDYTSHSSTGKFILAINPLETYKLTISAEGYEKIKTTFYPLESETKNNVLKFNLVKKDAQ